MLVVCRLLDSSSLLWVASYAKVYNEQQTFLAHIYLFEQFLRHRLIHWKVCLICLFVLVAKSSYFHPLFTLCIIIHIRNYSIVVIPCGGDCKNIIPPPTTAPFRYVFLFYSLLFALFFISAAYFLPSFLPPSFLSLFSRCYEFSIYLLTSTLVENVLRVAAHLHVCWPINHNHFARNDFSGILRVLKLKHTRPVNYFHLNGGGG